MYENEIPNWISNRFIVWLCAFFNVAGEYMNFLRVLTPFDMMMRKIEIQNIQNTKYKQQNVLKLEG